MTESLVAQFILLVLLSAVLMYVFLAMLDYDSQPKKRTKGAVWRCVDCGALNSTSDYCHRCGRFLYEDIDNFFDEEDSDL